MTNIIATRFEVRLFVFLESADNDGEVVTFETGLLNDTAIGITTIKTNKYLKTILHVMTEFLQLFFCGLLLKVSLAVSLYLFRQNLLFIYIVEICGAATRRCCGR